MSRRPAPVKRGHLERRADHQRGRRSARPRYRHLPDHRTRRGVRLGRRRESSRRSRRWWATGPASCAAGGRVPAADHQCPGLIARRRSRGASSVKSVAHPNAVFHRPLNVPLCAVRCPRWAQVQTKASGCLHSDRSDSRKGMITKHVTIERTLACWFSVHLLGEQRPLVLRRDIQEPGK